MKSRTTVTTVNGRPTPVLVEKPTTGEGILVACRLASGEDAYIPLRDLFTLFEKELATRLRMNGR